MNEKGQTVVFVLIGVVGVVLFLALFFVWPIYNVWTSEQSGKAELARAEYSKRVAVETAKAKNDSAVFEADAEIARARGVAEANKIIGDSLKGKEEYLRYLYITGLKDQQNKEVIYVPTEAGIPILEANRLQPEAPKQ